MPMDGQFRDNSESTTENIDELISAIKDASEIRNVICHGSWRPPDPEGRSLPLFVNKRNEVFDTPLDIAYLHQVQSHIAELAATVADTVTHMGFQFPGGAGPGKQIWNSK